MTEVHHMKVSLQGDVFEATGAEESVRADYREWLQAKQALMGSRQNRANADMVGGGEGPPPEIPAEGIAKIFKDEGAIVTLNLRPKTGPADGLLLILWGFLVVKGVSSVFAPTLMKAATVSALGTDRVDRVIKDRFIMTGGRKRGKRYSLNNEGIDAAKRIAATLLR